MHILQDGDAVLREKSQPVPKSTFGKPSLTHEIQQMIDALETEPDGVAIAAPQIGILKRIFVVRYDRMLPPPREGDAPHPVDVGIFINPELVRTSRRKSEFDEGCLSVRGWYGTTIRHERATVKAYDEQGKAFERGGGGILAQAFQHEIDHLNGILFIDHAHNKREVPSHE